MSPLRNNLPNLASVLGVVPLCLAFVPGGSAWLPALLIYNNAMDDVDGLLARALRVESAYGAALDNLCDAVAHILLALLVAGPRGPSAVLAAAVASAAMLVRMSFRLTGHPRGGRGSTTNELMRHLLFVLLFERALGRDLGALLAPLLLLHAASLVAPIPMPYLLRTLARTPAQIALVNVSLVAAWLWPPALPVSAAAHGAAYLLSLGAGLRRYGR